MQRGQKSTSLSLNEERDMAQKNWPLCRDCCLPLVLCTLSGACARKLRKDEDTVL